MRGRKYRVASARPGLTKALLLAATVVPALSFAETESPDVQLREIRISTTKSATENEDSPRSVSVIGKEEIATQATTGGVQEVLATIPGIDYARSGGLGGQIVMRGFNSNSSRSMLAIDGDRYRGRSTLEFNMIDPNSIERVEVIRGPASALWGADAMNGVVNVITRRAHVDRDAPFSMEAKIKAVEYNSVNNLWAGRGELIGGGNGFDALIGLNYRKAEDYDTPKGVAENSRFESQGLDFRLGYSPTDKTRWELAGRFQDTTSGRAGGLGAAPGAPWLTVTEDPIREQYLKIGVESKELGAAADLFDASLYVRRLETDIYQKNATAANGTLAAVTVNQHIKVDAPTVLGGRMNATKAIGDHLLGYGTDFYHENFNSRSAQTTRTSTATGAVQSTTSWSPMERGSEQTNIGFYVNDDWKIAPAFTLSGALRWDYIKTSIDPNPIAGESATVTSAINRAGLDRIDRPLTGSLGGVWDLTEQWSLVSQVSQGFLAPSGNARTLTSASGTITTVPSPDLKPEHSLTYEAGVRYKARGFRLNTTVYQSNYTDLIQLAVIDATTRQRRNVAKAEITGVEVDGEWRFAKPWLLKMMATATRGTNKSSGTPLDSIQPLAGRLALAYGVEDAPWSVEGVLRGAAARTRVDTSSERPRPGYGTMDFYLKVDLGKVTRQSALKNWRAVAGVQNAFDKEIVNSVASEDLRYAQGFIGNPLLEPGRAFMVKLVQDY